MPSNNRKHRVYGGVKAKPKTPKEKKPEEVSLRKEIKEHKKRVEHEVHQKMISRKSHPETHNKVFKKVEKETKQNSLPVGHLPRSEEFELKPKQKQRANNEWLQKIGSLVIYLVKGFFVLLYVVLRWALRLIFSKKGKGKLGVGRIIKRLVIYGLVAGLLMFVLGTSYVFWISRSLPDPDRLAAPDREIAQSTIIYDRTGETVLYEIFNEKRRTLVELEDIPEFAVQATIAVEDKFFFEHKGVRWISVARAMFSNVIGRRKGAGGASTLTQQLIKNAIVGDERSYVRKIKEAILATRLEKKYSKEQILKLYFNEIPYGSTNYGIAAAAQSYFGKELSELSLSEAVVLAALPKAPTRYLNDFESLKDRRDFILGLMVEQGYIDELQADEAKKEEVNPRKVIGNIKAPHFALYVRELLTEEYGERMIDTGGLRVYTTLDWGLQEIAQEEVTKGVEKLEESHNVGNAALVAIDPHTGEILSMVGSRDFFDDEHDGQVNVAMRLRQPGSSLKPFIYTAGFEKGYTPDTVLYDVVTDFDSTKSEPYVPHNYDGKERGPVTVRNALQTSLNIPAVKMTYLVGVQPVIDFLEKFGYTSFRDRSRFGLSLVLGGGEVRLMEHTAAYAALATEGRYREPISILRVEDAKGNKIFEAEKNKGKEIIDVDFARTIISVLTDDAARVPLVGAGSLLTLPGRPVAAKTGTTNDYRDGWTLGFTPSLVAGVWAGNNDNTEMKRAGGYTAAAPIWNAFMRRALEGTPVESFAAPPENKATKPVLRGVSSGGVRALIDTISGKLATSSTPKEFRKEKIFVQPHSILHYVNKDDPNGSVPEDPTQSAQYELWENAIQTWLEKKKEEGVEFEFSEPPTEFDDIHDVKLSPKVKINSPSPGEIIQDRMLTASVEASAPRGVKRVVYEVDGKRIYESNVYPFMLEWRARELENGEHELTARAYDDVSNAGSTTVKFNLQAPQDPPDVTWVYPRYNTALFPNLFPLRFSLNFFRADAMVEIEFFVTPEGKEDEKFSIGSLDQFVEDAKFTWDKAPPKGTYIIEPVILLGTGAKINGAKWQIRVR